MSDSAIAANPAAQQPAPHQPADDFGKTSPVRMAIGGIAVLLAILSGFATFFILSGLTPIVPDHDVVVTALLVNGFLVLVLFLLVMIEAVRLLLARRKGIAGARLHGRIVGLFAVIAAVPAIIVAIIASVTLDRGLDRWFSGQTREIVENSASVADAYLQDQVRRIDIDEAVLLEVVQEARELYDADKARFDELLRGQVSVRSISGLYIIREDLTIITRIVEKADDKFLVPPPAAFERVNKGETVILTPGPTDNASQVSALAKVKNYDGLYLYLVRLLDPAVMRHLRATALATTEYKELEARRLGVQVAFGLMYVGITFILLLSAVWIGFWFANRLVAPIRRLINAARLVSEGDLEVNVPVRRSEGELGSLGKTFNRMTIQLRNQREDLLDANVKLDTRRRFTEAVLAGVTAGVIGLDEKGVVDLVNRSAEAILEVGTPDLIGKPLASTVPELASFLDQAIRHGQRLVSGQIELKRDGHERNVTVRVTSEEAGPAGRGFVVTLDDITELVSAQRTSAWADVARRIAHEIKNPLTPIQLSAERLRRKYGKVIGEDSQVFEQCTDTIIRQVGDIGRMVDEFSSFARMPKATMARENLAAVVRDAPFLFSIGKPDVKVEVNVPDEPIYCACDSRLLSQAVTNLVKNATEAISAATMKEGETPWIRVDLTVEGNTARIDVTDNGCGLPHSNRQRLLEPYMTTREKGTGLGLAIVRKIVEDHGGAVSLADAPQVAEGGHGARVTIELPLSRKTAGEGDTVNGAADELARAAN